MRRSTTRLAPLALALAFTAACVTIQVYFPAARIQDLSEQIETEVERKAAERRAIEAPAPASSEPPAAEAPQSQETPGAPATPQASEPPRAGIGPLGAIGRLLGGRPAFAADGSVPAPDVSSPAIRRLIDSRAARVDELNRAKTDGIVGETNQALVTARALEKVSDLARRAAVQRLVEAENADRRLLFEEIATAEGVDRAQIPRIQATYAQTLRRHARPGDWVQAPDGSWEQVR